MFNARTDKRLFFLKKNLLWLVFCFLSNTKTRTLTCWCVRAWGNTKSGNIRFRSAEKYFSLNPMYHVDMPGINSLKRNGIRNVFKYLLFFQAPVLTHLNVQRTFTATCTFDWRIIVILQYIMTVTIFIIRSEETRLFDDFSEENNFTLSSTRRNALQCPKL